MAKIPELCQLHTDLSGNYYIIAAFGKYLFENPAVNRMLERAVARQDVQGMQLEAFKCCFQTLEGKLHGHT